MSPLVLRPAGPDDLERTFAWANDPVARSVSFQSAPIPLETHARWFRDSLARADRKLLIAELGTGQGTVPVAVVRFDRGGLPDGEAVVSVNVDPERRGQGLGPQALDAATRYARGEGIRRIVALIRPDNRPSIRAFERAGYQADGTQRTGGAGDEGGIEALRYVRTVAEDTATEDAATEDAATEEPVTTKPAFLPYGRQTIEDDDIAAVVEALRSDYLTTGPRVTAFEQSLARYVGARHAVAVANGTAALHVACLAADLGPGDEVIVPAVTFLATANCATYVGARPVFADVDPDTGLVDLASARSRISGRTKAFIPVHLTGAPVDLDGCKALADQAGAWLIEDAAHALGATWQGAPVGDGRHGRMAIWSFHPVKHVTTGEGGAVTTADDDLAFRLRTVASHGIVRDPARLETASPGPWYHEMQSLGFNYRLTDLQCALGVSQLAKAARFLDRRHALAARYDRLLAGLPAVRPVTGPAQAADSAYHLYAVLIDFAALGRTRAEVMQALHARGVGTQVHYIPIPSQPFYRRLGWDMAEFPGAARFYARELSLPLYPGMADTDVDRVVEALADVLSGR